MNNILFTLSDKLYHRDPQKTVIGQTLLSHSIRLIDRCGFDNITFRKIAEEMDSTEATIYRYFENKFRLLQYLVDWYWASLNFQMNFHMNNVDNPEEKLKICLQLLAGTREGVRVSSIDFAMLHRVVISEFDKIYLTKTIDKDYRNGLLDPFKDTCRQISSLVKEVNPAYPFPHSLISTTITAAIHQVYYSKHLPSISDIKSSQKSMNENLYQFLENFVFNAIRRTA